MEITVPELHDLIHSPYGPGFGRTLAWMVGKGHKLNVVLPDGTVRSPATTMSAFQLFSHLFPLSPAVWEFSEPWPTARPWPLDKNYGKVPLNPGPDGKYQPEPGWSMWVEDGVCYTAPEVPADKFGPHEFCFGHRGVCFKCGCSMSSDHSSGECDPFGPCPENPR